MDLTSDLIGIQGILSSLIKNTGEFTRVNYRGGNEDIILKVMLEIQQFLKNRKYIIDEDKPNEMYDRQLKDVVLFLALNTSYKHFLEMDEYSHLLNITPPLSKCLFANVVYGLDLCKYYCTVIETLPICNSVELLDEVLQCLKKSTPNVHLKYARMFLKAAANKLSSIHFSQKIEEHVDNLCEVTNVMLLNLSGMYTDQIKNWKKDQIYNHMGFCLLALLELLLHCDENCLALKKFVVNVMRACCSVVKNVTIDVFCAWAETEIEDEILQTVVSNKAYLVLELYQKLPEARDLVSVLGSIAKKPKSLTEQIHEANVEMIIKKVNKGDSDQKTWFRALIRTQIFENEEAFNCVRHWSHLCDEEDVSILLNWCLQKHNEKSAKLTIKCMSNLNLSKLTIVATKYFYKNKFLNLSSTTDVETTLTWLLNKVKEDKNVEEYLTKDILVLFLQQPTAVLIYLYEECLKNSFYTNVLQGTFEVLKEIIKINSIGTTLLLKVTESKPPNAQNLENYVQLFTTLIQVKYFSNEDVILKIIGAMLNKYYSEKNLEVVDLVLQMFLGGTVTLKIMEETRDLTKLLLTIMNENRCKFLNFDGLKQQIAKHSVDICCEVCTPCYSSEVNITIVEEDYFTQYYRSYLTSGIESSLFKTLCDSFNIGDYGNCVNAMLKFIPPAVSREWLVIAQEIIDICGNDKCMELFTDVIILLSQLVETQELNDNDSIYAALKDCVRNYGLIVQQKLLNNSTLEAEINVNRQILRALAKLPNLIKEEQGLCLVNILTDRSLKSLAEDKDFLCRLILIKNPTVCRVLAQKITG